MEQDCGKVYVLKLPVESKLLKYLNIMLFTNALSENYPAMRLKIRTAIMPGM